MAYQDELLENYDSLRADRDWSPAAMAENIEQRDPALAAEYRQRFAEESGTAKPPAKRRGKADAEQAEG